MVGEIVIAGHTYTQHNLRLCYTRPMKNIFRVVANRVSAWAGSAGVFLGAIVIVIIWATTGPVFGYSDTWQLIINTGTTIVTFLMVFLIQNTQNRDGKALQIKLDELLRATKGAKQYYIGLEDLTDEELAELERQFKELANKPSTARAIKRLQETIESARVQRSGLRSILPIPEAKPKDTDTTN